MRTDSERSKKRRSSKSPEPSNLKIAKSGESPKAADDTEAFSEFMIYGKICNLHNPPSEAGSCFECRGTRNTKLPKDHPVLLCDGEGCTREYHLSCVIYPKPLDSVPDGKFFCEDCLPDGTSATLTSYFDAVDDLRAEFSTSKEFVNFLHSLHTQGMPARALLPMDQCADIDELVSIVAPDSLQMNNPQELTVPISELSRAVTLHNAAMRDPEILLHNTSSQQLSPSSVQLREESKNSSIDEDAYGPELLVGKVVRIYCPINNQYHNGRIIDWRSARLVKSFDQHSHKDEFFGNYEIATSEFLVRFPAGMNGRKAEVIRWIVLEEHSCAVSVALIMGLRDKGRGINGWKPAQLVLRTTIELIPVHDRIQEVGNFALLIFFGDDNHLYTDLDTDCVDIVSKKFEQYRVSKLNSSPGTVSSYSHSVVEFMNMVMALVEIELEEQRRTYEWHKLILKDYAHPKCLSMRNEYGTPPLRIDECKEVNDHDSNVIQDDPESHTIIMKPKLCPLIQHGLDRQWIWNQITDKRVTLDNAVSLSQSNTISMTEKIALMNKDM